MPVPRTSKGGFIFKLGAGNGFMDSGRIEWFDVLTTPLPLLFLILPKKPEIRIEVSSCERGMTLARLLSLLLALTATVSIAEAQNNDWKIRPDEGGCQAARGPQPQFERLALGARVPGICQGNS